MLLITHFIIYYLWIHPRVIASAKIVCYYASWAASFSPPSTVRAEDINPNLCTHIIYAFVSIADDGTLKPINKKRDVVENGYTNITCLKTVNSTLKVLLSIGSTSSNLFSNIASDETKTDNLVKSARHFMERYGFDGIDIDWEFPLINDKVHFVKLLQHLKEDFQRNNWKISLATKAFPTTAYNVSAINSIVDFVNIMTYNYYGPWSVYVGPNSALFPSSRESHWEKQHLNIASNVNEWINSGIVQQKIIIGIPFYGRTFTLQDPKNYSLHAPFKGIGDGGPFRKSKGIWTYFEFCSFAERWKQHWDNEQKTSTFLMDDQWLSIETKRSIKEKTNYVKLKSLGGVMIWSIDQDDVNGECGLKSSLLYYIRHCLL